MPKWIIRRLCTKRNTLHLPIIFSARNLEDIIKVMHPLVNFMAMLNIDKYFGDFSLTATLGTSIQDVNYQYYDVGGSLNSVADGFTMLNLMQSAVKFQQDGYHDQTQSIFATAQLGWKSKLYLDVTGRVDWSSALAWTDTKSVAYPSVGVSAILTELLLEGTRLIQ